MLILSVAFLVSLIVTLMMIRYSSLHAHITADRDLDGVREFHAHPVPRVDGLGIVLALATTIVTAQIRDPKLVGYPFLLPVFCVMPAFVAGFVEDIAKRVSPRERLLATMVTALTTVYFLNVKIVRIDVRLVDMALAFPIISIVVTTITVTGLTNSINIVDGFSGLAFMVAIMMFVPLAYVASHVGNMSVLTIAFAMIGAILGFFIWNFPAGCIFLGDGGAYMTDFVLAECSTLPVLRNISISAWYPILIVICPVFGTLFSTYRRRILKRVPAGHPDRVHLHTLIYQRIIRWAVDSKDKRHRLQRNSLTSPYLWLPSLLMVLPATLFWDNELTLLGSIAVFIFFYVWLYWRIVRFQSSRWLIVKKRHRVKKHHEH